MGIVSEFYPSESKFEPDVWDYSGVNNQPINPDVQGIRLSSINSEAKTRSIQINLTSENKARITGVLNKGTAPKNQYNTAKNSDGSANKPAPKVITEPQYRERKNSGLAEISAEAQELLKSQGFVIGKTEELGNIVAITVEGLNGKPLPVDALSKVVMAMSGEGSFLSPDEARAILTKEMEYGVERVPSTSNVSLIEAGGVGPKKNTVHATLEHPLFPVTAISEVAHTSQYNGKYTTDVDATNIIVKAGTSKDVLEALKKEGLDATVSSTEAERSTSAAERGIFASKIFDKGDFILIKGVPADVVASALERQKLLHKSITDQVVAEAVKAHPDQVEVNAAHRMADEKANAKIHQENIERASAKKAEQERLRKRAFAEQSGESIETESKTTLAARKPHGLPNEHALNGSGELMGAGAGQTDMSDGRVSSQKLTPQERVRRNELTEAQSKSPVISAEVKAKAQVVLQEAMQKVGLQEIPPLWKAGLTEKIAGLLNTNINHDFANEKSFGKGNQYTLAQHAEDVKVRVERGIQGGKDSSSSSLVAETGANKTPAAASKSANKSVADASGHSVLTPTASEAGFSTALFLEQTINLAKNFKQMSTSQQVFEVGAQGVYGTATVVDIGKWISKNPGFGGIVGETAMHSASALGFITAGVSAYKNTSELADNVHDGNVVGATVSSARLFQDGIFLAGAAEKVVPLAGRTLGLISGEVSGGTLIGAAASKAALPLTIAQIAFSGATAVTLDWQDSRQEQFNATLQSADNENARNFKAAFAGDYKATSDIVGKLPLVPLQEHYVQLNGMKNRKDADGNSVNIDLDSVARDPGKITQAIESTRHTLDTYAKQNLSSLEERQAAYAKMNSWSRTSLVGNFIDVITPGDWDKNDRKEFEHADKKLNMAMQATGAAAELNDYKQRMEIYLTALKGLNPENPAQAADTYKEPLDAVKNLQAFYADIRHHAQPNQIKDGLGKIGDSNDPAVIQQRETNKAEFEMLHKIVDETTAKVRVETEQKLGFAHKQSEFAAAQKKVDDLNKLYADMSHKYKGYSGTKAGHDLDNLRQAASATAENAKAELNNIAASVHTAENEQKQKGQIALVQYYATRLAEENVHQEWNKVTSMSPEKQADHFEKNAEFIAKTGLKDRKDLAAVSLSTNIEELVAKRMDEPAFGKEMMEMAKQNQKILEALKTESGHNVSVSVDKAVITRMEMAQKNIEDAQKSLQTSIDASAALAKSMEMKDANGGISQRDMAASREIAKEINQKQVMLVTKQYTAIVTGHALLVEANNTMLAQKERSEPHAAVDKAHGKEAAVVPATLTHMVDNAIALLKEMGIGGAQDVKQNPSMSQVAMAADKQVSHRG